MSDDEDDPFERLDESVGEREGDPFEAFEDVDTSDDEREETAGTDQPDPLAGDDDPREEPEYDGHDVTPAGHRDELADEDARAGADGEEADSEDVSVGSVDSDDVTVGTVDSADADSEGADGAEADAEGVVEMDEPEIDTGSDDPFGDVGGRAGDPFDDDIFEEMDVGEMDPDEVWESIADAEARGSVSEEAERIYADVSKHRFCEQCEFFSDPPDVACSHEGTEILEFLDNETVRVVDCPVVAERKELEKHD